MESMFDDPPDLAQTAVVGLSPTGDLHGGTGSVRRLAVFVVVLARSAA